MYVKIGDIWGRKIALLAWKLGSRGTVVEEVVVLDGAIDGSIGVHWRIKKGEETINTRQ